MAFSAEELNLARHNLLQGTVNYFLARKSVVALYLQGSVAANSTDEYSDIDLRVVIQPNAYEQYISERFEAPQQWGEWLYNEWAGRAWVCVSHFKPFNKIDVLYFKPDDLQPSPWFSLPTQVLYDPTNIVGEIIQASHELVFTIETEEVERLISKGLAHAEEIYRRIMRAELFYAQSLLDGFRSILMRIDDYRCGAISPSAPSSHFERRGSPTCMSVLKLSYTSLDKLLLLQALGELLRLYQSQIIQLHEALTMQRDIQTDLSMICIIMELCLEQTDSAN